jgi:hypothetical protein
MVGISHRYTAIPYTNASLQYGLGIGQTKMISSHERIQERFDSVSVKTFIFFYFSSLQKNLYQATKKVNSVALVRKRTIPTERPPLVGEVNAQPLRVEGVAWSVQRIPTAVNLGFPDRCRYFFIQVVPQLSSRG